SARKEPYCPTLPPPRSSRPNGSPTGQPLFAFRIPTPRSHDTMSRLARLLHRCFCRPARRLGLAAAPAVISRNGPSLAGESLTRSFGSGETKAYALQGASLDLFPGELNLLMGPSGSGKSTLLAVLSGLLRPDAGAVSAMGDDLWGMSDDAMERFRLRHCSYIFQGYNLFPALTAREQLEIVL